MLTDLSQEELCLSIQILPNDKRTEVPATPPPITTTLHFLGRFLIIYKLNIDKMSKSSKSILVTGGAGYIGSHIVEQLIKNKETVIILDNLGYWI
jgi:FlaA1/EpsC-like NDP-sugar epimerase